MTADCSVMSNGVPADCSVMSNGVTADCSVMSNGVPADCRAERVMEVEQVERDQRGQSALRPSLYSEGVRGVRSVLIINFPYLNFLSYA